MKFIFKYLWKYKGLLCFDFLMVFGFVIAEMGLPILLAEIINKGLPNKDYPLIQKQVLFMVAIILIAFTMTILLNYFVSKLSTMIVRDIRNDLFEHLETFSHKEYEQIGVASLITRVTNDAFQIYQFVSQILRLGFITPIMFSVSIVMILNTAPTLSIYVWCALPIMILSMVLLAKFSEPMSQAQQENLDKMNEMMRENLSGFRVIRAFVREHFVAKRFEKVNVAYQKSTKALFKLLAAADPAFSLLFNIVMAFVLWNGAMQIAGGTLELGSLLAFFDFIFHMLFSFMLLAMVFMMYPRANVSAKRIQEALSIQSVLVDVENSVENDVETCEKPVEIVFDNVSFSYSDAEEHQHHLHEIFFTAKKGEVTAFVGSTGSGKSTLIQLIPRFYDVSQGSILISGRDVREFPLVRLREKIGYIPQKAQLYSGTIRENLLFGKENATEEELIRALKLSDAYRFVSEKEQGLDSVVSEGGANFSGGQKQRLAIARALVRQPEIYIFDDSFSALDAKTDAKIRKNLKAATKEAVTLIVAQRISSIMDADKIIVLNNGKIEAIGTHHELLKISQTYREIAESQLTKEELERG
ncbi:ATP-binding cassette, subfamily B, multidrug efflux pump [Pilibacter termitis]|uniref:ATP-binding cassette, subfamily B, multidrug efflux pump n=1 Tax=Pilibacter termitis TaxID=263852 RepID=A0A1T4R2P1_9ENTE|nr:ABC transporter ATP-binding protein [Pilibacter termitis]SKA10312.1 ATP-binding cassette, subfamily B, multidrug efflux pump [Pilibacter termitis]